MTLMKHARIRNTSVFNVATIVTITTSSTRSVLLWTDLNQFTIPDQDI